MCDLNIDVNSIFATKWDLCATEYKGMKGTEKNFRQCLREYLEVTAKCTNLGDQVI